MERLVSGLETLIADIESANGIMGEAVVSGDLRKETMEIEIENVAKNRGSRL